MFVELSYSNIMLALLGVDGEYVAVMCDE